MTEEKISNGDYPSFPLDTGYGFYKGLTKREYMATQLMSGLLSHGQDVKTSATHAVNAADILLRQLNNEK